MQVLRDAYQVNGNVSTMRTNKQNDTDMSRMKG